MSCLSLKLFLAHLRLLLGFLALKSRENGLLNTKAAGCLWRRDCHFFFHITHFLDRRSETSVTGSRGSSLSNGLHLF